MNPVLPIHVAAGVRERGSGGVKWDREMPTPWTFLTPHDFAPPRRAPGAPPKYTPRGEAPVLADRAARRFLGGRRRPSRAVSRKLRGRLPVRVAPDRVH